VLVYYKANNIIIIIIKPKRYMYLFTLLNGAHVVFKNNHH